MLDCCFSHCWCKTFCTDGVVELDSNELFGDSHMCSEFCSECVCGNPLVGGRSKACCRVMRGVAFCCENERDLGPILLEGTRMVTAMSSRGRHLAELVVRSLNSFSIEDI